MAEVNDWNSKIIEEFRANEGRVGGQFEGAPMILVHHIGAKSGTERVNPMMYRPAGDDFAVFASYAGAPTNPDWYHNLVAHPSVTVEVGTESLPVTARVTEGSERDELWSAQKADYPGFADYEAKTTRQIPVVVLERAR
ncbi:MAG: nitroreductase family deazaflavin-dependent oxidoreductase [Actinomycetota bacterium]|nr:nitroreductase family deazaflavin-dependent oxidoreductase [Actinomycetota bacterium]